MLAWAQESFIKLLAQLVVIDTQIILLAILLAIVVIVLDAVGLVNRTLREKSGVTKRSKATSIDGSQIQPGKNLVSEIQGLAGRPDGIIRENGYFIPVERKPLSKKIRDRHVAQLLVYMRLVEEFEGKKPPYGYLILGKKCRRVKIKNSESRQVWLQRYIDEMKVILSEEGVAVPEPQPQKCRSCSVRESCNAYRLNSQPSNQSRDQGRHLKEIGP